MSDQLPTYPNNIQGELRIILQTKDVFLVCYKHLEEYRRLVNEQNRLITKEFVQEQLQIGEDEITELKMELQEAENRLSGRLRHNELLADHLSSLGLASMENGQNPRHMAQCRSPQMRKSMLGSRGGSSRLTEPRPPTHMIDNIALAIAEIHSEVRSKVKPLLDYYRDLFYLQLHFTLVLGQVCNYCMPLVTENIGLIDRIFFWSERPEFDLVRRAGDIGDRLKEIYTRAQTVLGVLAESVRFLQSKVELQKNLETRFHERLDEQQKTKDKILREVHQTKQNMDMLEEENDRLVGSLVKLDPTFVDSRHFYELAEGGALLGKKGGGKETGQNNAEDEQVMMNNVTPAQRQNSREDYDRDSRGAQGTVVRSNRRSRNVASPSCLDNPTDEMNNNKALSMAGEAPNKVVETKSPPKKKVDKTELDCLLNEIRNKLGGGGGGGGKTHRRESSRLANRNNCSDTSRPVSSIGDTCDSMETQQQLTTESTTPTPRRSTRRAPSRTRSKSRKRDNMDDQSPVRTTKTKVRRRATSVERQPRQPNAKKVRSKSTVGGKRYREGDTTPINKPQRSPSKHVEEPQTTSLSSAAGDSVGQQHAPAGTLKSRLLGRTKDLLEAALHRSPKNSTTEPISRTPCDLDTSLSTEHLDQEELSNDAVTSVSSFASQLAGDSSLGEPGMINANSIIPSRQMRSSEMRKTNRRSVEPKKLSKRNRRGQGGAIEYISPPLPALSADTLLTENHAGTSMNQLGSTGSFNSHKSKKGRSNLNLSTFLTGSNLDSVLPTNSPQSSLPALL